MASGGSDQDAKDALSKLLQMGTEAAYRNEFEMLINRVTDISESLLKTFYISGLKLALQCALLRSNPTTLGEAFSLARAMEAHYADLQLWELLRSNPTTLGEAFFKARITEAHFEDERSTIAIAKTNDLNTGVQVQDLELETKVLLDGKQDDTKVVKVMGVVGHQNSDEPSVLKGCKLQSPLVSSFRRNVRGGIEEQQLEHLVALLDFVILSNSNDRWVSDLNGDGVFRVKDVRNLLDEFFLPRADIPTRWVKNIPIKVNIFAWKLALDRLPTRANLVQRNVVTESQSCPLCDAILEDTSHLFFNCSLARDVTRLLCRWWNLGVQTFSSYAEWLVWFNSVRLASNFKLLASVSNKVAVKKKVPFGLIVGLDSDLDLI
ncbi:RNA-directed DNA polymerase, eukaryota [Tanacetum coccineum]